MHTAAETKVHSVHYSINMLVKKEEYRPVH